MPQVHKPPNDVLSPHARWELLGVIYDGGEGEAAVAFGKWDKRPAIVTRWNGDDEEGRTLGNPQSSGHATWFVLPDWLIASTLQALVDRQAAGDTGVNRSTLDDALARFKATKKVATYDHDLVYRRIGEFVVSFQWVEARLREIGWLILDPNRERWPPQELRRESNDELIRRVERLYVDLVGSLNVEDRVERQRDFSTIAEDCHRMRRQRNNLLHSAYIELKSGDDVHGILRTSPRLAVDPDTGEPTLDQEILSDERMDSLMTELGQVALRLNFHYLQLIYWMPFDHLREPGEVTRDLHSQATPTHGGDRR